MFQYPDIYLKDYADTGDLLGLDMRNIDILVGTLKKDQMNGEFEIFHHGILFFEGTVKDNQIEGEGTAYYPDSDQVQYKGEWKDGKYDGKGILYDENGEVKYKGNWSEGDYAH